MPLSRKVRIISVIAILGLLTFVIIYFFQKHRNQDLKNLKQDFKLRNEQAEGLKNVQLDSARSCAYDAYQLVIEEPSLEFEKNVAILTLSEIKFLQFGASARRYNRVEKCEKWFRDHKFYDEVFRANLLRLEIKSFLKGDAAVWESTDKLIDLARSCKNDAALAQAYYFKMQKRDYSRKWEDDVYLLDSARLLANKIKDSVLLAKIRLTSVLPVNGGKASFDSTFLSLKEAERWNSRELKCLIYESLALEFMPNKNKSDSAIYYLDKGGEVASKWGSLPHLSYMKYRKVFVYDYSLETEKFINYGKEILPELKRTNHKEREFAIIKIISSGYLSKQAYSEGMEYAIDALEIAQKLDNEMEIFSAKMVIALFLVAADRFSEAEKICTELLDWAKKREKTVANEKILANAMYLKALFLEESGDLKKALTLLKETAIVKKDHTGWRKFQVESSILKVLIGLKDYDEAKKQYDFIVQNYTETYRNSPKFIFIEGKILFESGMENEAISAFNSLLDYGENISNEVRYTSRTILSGFYEKKGQFRLALEHNKEALKLKGEMDKTEDALKLEKIQSKYELSQKETKIQKLDIERLEQKNDLKAKENKLQTRRYYIILLSVLLVLLAVIIIFIYRRSKEARVREDLERIALEKERQVERLKSEESKRAIEIKNQLFANISHEFRTPLTLIQAPVEELLDKAEENSKKPLEVVKRNADHLLVMIDEILELAKLDSGNTNLSKKELGLKNFVQRLRMNFQPIFRQKNIQFETNLPVENYVIIADEYRLKMVLNNILKNAFHHASEKGFIKLSASFNVKEEIVEMSVFNSGDWIDEEFLPTIFERYSRSKDKEYSGYGIGLSFCKQIVSLHGGDIMVENVEGGVLVSFTIPSTFIEIESSALNEVENVTEESTLYPLEIGQHKLLIVEDNLEMQSLLNDLLRDQFDLMFANNGQEGIEKAEQNQPDLIISDIMMPKVGGMELTRTLKENFSTSHIPIILLTAKSAGHDRIAGLETGAEDYLTKPFSPKELRVRVRNLIEQRKKLKRRFSKNVFLIPEEITSNSLDQEFLLKATEIVESSLDNSEFSVEQFCRELALNRNSVHQKLKSLTGSSASQFIKSIKLKKSAILLADERTSILEVSELSGFNNRQAFYKAFKEQFEVTPLAYRKDYLSKNS